MTEGGNPTSANPLLTDDEQMALTDARLRMWKLEALEFAYSSRVRQLSTNRTILDFLGIAVAIVFLFLQYLATKENAPRLHDILGYIGTFLSLMVLLWGIWALICRWTDQTEKKRSLAKRIRELLSRHRKLSEARPIELTLLREWVADVEAFDGDRDHDLAPVSRYYILRGYQHVARKYPNSGMACSVCHRKWTPEMNKQTWRTRVPFMHCEGCGVKA